MPTHEHMSPGQAVDSSARSRPNKSLAGPGADQELEREMLARQAAMGPVAASPPPDESPGSWIPSWFTQMLAVSGSASSGPAAPGGPSSNANGSATASRDGLSARGTAITSYEDGRASAITGAGHWSQDEGLSTDIAATRTQSTTVADSDTSWERNDHAVSTNASYSADEWSAEASRSSGRTSHYNGHEVSTASRSAVTATQDGLGLNHQSNMSIDDDGVRNESQRDSSVGWSWEHGLNLGFGTSSVVSDGDDYRTTNDYGMSYDRGVVQGNAGNSSHVVDSDGQVLDSANTYAGGWDMKHGVFGSASQSSSIINGDDYQRRQSSLAYSGQDGLAAGMSTASRQTNEDGIVHTDDRSATASWSTDAQSVSLSRATSRNDDGIVRSTDSQGTFGYSDEAGLSAVASTSRVLSDGDDFSLARSADMALSAEGGHAGLSSTSHVVDSDGVTHDGSQSGRVGWDPQGLLAEYRQSQSTSEGDDYNRRESVLGYGAGAFNAGSTFGSRGTADDGTVCSVDAAYSASIGPEGAQVSGSHARGTSWDGITGGTSSQATLGRDADGNVSWSGSTQRGIADNDEYHDRTGATASYQEGLFTAQGTSDVRYTDADSVRRDRQRTAGMTFGNGSAGLTASQQSSTLDDGIGVNTRNTGSATSGPDGAWSLGGTHERSVSMDDDYGTTRGVGGSIRHDGFELNASDSARWTDADNTAHTSSGGVTAGFRDGHASAGGEWSRSATRDDGTSSHRSHQVGVSTDGTLSAGMSGAQRDADGNITRGHSVGGSADLLGDQRRVTGTGSMTRGKRTYSAGGGIEYEVNTPEQRGNSWVVTYRQGISANAGGSATQGGGVNADTGMARAGVSGGLSAGAQVMTSGVRTFASQAEAVEFYERPSLGLMDGPSANIAGVLAMRDGDSSSSLMTGSLGAQGSASWGPFLTASAGAQAGASTGMTVERGAGQSISVTIEDASTLAGTLGLSTIGLGMSAGVSERDFEAVTWTFDLSKPNAQEAYSAYVGQGQTPVAGDGVVMDSVTVGEAETSTTTVMLPGVAFASKSTRESTSTDFDNGDTLESDTGSQGILSSIGAFFGYSRDEEHGMSFYELNDERRWMAGKSEVNDSNAYDSRVGLAEAAGVEDTFDRAVGEPSGKWTYETTFPEAGLDEFVDTVTRGDFDPHSAYMIQRYGHHLVDDLRAADGDTDKQREILADYIERTGHTGAWQVREHVHGEEGFLLLEGNETFTGAAGVARLQSQIDTLRVQSTESSTPSLLIPELDSLLAKLHHRSDDIQDYGRYPDIPDALRTTERLRNDDLLEQATQLREHIADGAGPEFGEVDSKTDDETKAQAIQEHERNAESYQRALQQRWLHNDGWPNAREELGSSGVFGVALVGPEYLAYTSIDGMWAPADTSRRRGSDAMKAARRQESGSVGDAQTSVQYWEESASSFIESTEGYTTIIDTFLAIQGRHQGETQLW